MTTLLLLTYAALVRAQVAPLSFTTGIRGQAIRVELPDLNVGAGFSMIAGDLVDPGLMQARAALNAVTMTAERTVRLHGWRPLLTFGVWLKVLAADPTAAEVDTLRYGPLLKLLQHPYPDEVLAHDDPYELARLAVRPYRENWLYGPHDAATLNEVETYLRRSLWINRLRHLVHTGEDLRRLDVNELKLVIEEVDSWISGMVRIWNRQDSLNVDFELVRRFGRVHVAESRDLLLTLLHREVARLNAGDADARLFTVAIGALAGFGGLRGTSLIRFDDLVDAVKRVHTPYAETLLGMLNGARAQMLGRADEPPSLSRLYAEARATCVSRLAP